MKTIYKYPLMIKDLQIVMMHSPGEILKVGSQNGQVCIWALADSDAPIIECKIAICGTGLSCPYPIEQHLGTVIIGGFVWHVFSA